MRISDESRVFHELSFEFLRRVVNELNGRKFNLLDASVSAGAWISSGGKSEMLTASAKQNEVLKILPEMTREFAQKIRAEFTQCYKLAPHPERFGWYFAAIDPISGMSVRCLRYYDPIKSDIYYRFDAAFG